MRIGCSMYIFFLFFAVCANRVFAVGVPSGVYYDAPTEFDPKNGSDHSSPDSSQAASSGSMHDSVQSAELEGVTGVGLHNKTSKPEPLWIGKLNADDAANVRQALEILDHEFKDVTFLPFESLSQDFKTSKTDIKKKYEGVIHAQENIKTIRKDIAGAIQSLEQSVNTLESLESIKGNAEVAVLYETHVAKEVHSKALGDMSMRYRDDAKTKAGVAEAFNATVSDIRNRQTQSKTAYDKGLAEARQDKDRAIAAISKGVQSIVVAYGGAAEAAAGAAESYRDAVVKVVGDKAYQMGVAARAAKDCNQFVQIIHGLVQSTGQRMSQI